jgi:hypothetical protein
LNFPEQSLQRQWKSAEKKNTSKPRSKYIDVQDLIQRASLTAEKVSSLSVCPQLKGYRNELKIEDATANVLSRATQLLATLKDNGNSYPSYAPTSNKPFENLSNEDFAVDSYVPAADVMDQSMDLPLYADYNENDNDYFGNTTADENSRDSGDYFAVDEPALPSPRGSIAPVESTKVLWTVNQEDSNTMQKEIKVIAESIDQAGLNANNDYAYFNMEELHSSGNAWAGAKHWKYATRQMKKIVDTAAISNEIVSTASQSVDTLDDSSKASTIENKATTKKSKTAAANVFSLSLVPVDESKFGKGTGKTDTSLLTSAAIDKMESESESLLLPRDEKMSVRDLCRLFLLPNMIVKPKSASNLSKRLLAKAQNKTVSKASILLEAMDGEERFFPTEDDPISTSTSFQPESSTTKNKKKRQFLKEE